MISKLLIFCKTGVENQEQVFRGSSYFTIHVFFVFWQPHNIIFVQAKLFTLWIAFDWVGLPNLIEHNLMDGVRLGSICLIEFDWLGNRTHIKFGDRFGSITEFNKTQSMDWGPPQAWVRFPNAQSWVHFKLSFVTWELPDLWELYRSQVKRLVYAQLWERDYGWWH